MLLEMNFGTFPVPVCAINPFNCAPQKKCGFKSAPCVKKEVENTMTETEITRNYLVRRLDDVNYTKTRSFTKLFGLENQKSPSTYKEMIDWIKNDKFTIDAKQAKRIDICVDEDGEYYGSFLDGIIWNGNDSKRDTDGYQKALDDAKGKYQAVKDSIYVLPAADALKALNDFEAWTPTTSKQ